MQDFNPVCPSVGGCLEAIEQGIALIRDMTKNEYTYKAQPYVESSIGEHLRHITDMYLALMNAGQTGVIDYDFRRRGAAIEYDVSAGMQTLTDIRTWLQALQPSEVDRPVTILCEASVSSQQVCEMPSSLRRELLFVGSHTVHHFALIRVVTQHLNIETNELFGYAPATATYLRGQA